LNINIYTEPSVFDALRDSWDSLVERSTANLPFNRLVWHESWWAAYAPGRLWVITFTSAEGNLLGIAPFFVEDDPDVGRVVRFIGHVDVTDYMDLIFDHDHAEALYQQLAEFLAGQSGEFDAIGLANLREDSQTYAVMVNKLRECGFEAKYELIEVAPQIPLPMTYEDYLSDSVSGKQRKEIKRKMRRAEGGEYDVQWYTVGPAHDLDAELERFLHLMGRADKEKAEFLENPQHVDFFQRIMPRMNDLGYLKLDFITIDGEACAAYLNFVDGAQVFVYNSGLEPEQFGALSPGIVLLQFIIRDAIEHGYKVFDFLRGGETYKHRMGGTDLNLYQLNASLEV
jgi:CelD/BcsL family acetyltransferase involved in cellulose biosynthesis